MTYYVNRPEVDELNRSSHTKRFYLKGVVWSLSTPALAKAADEWLMKGVCNHINYITRCFLAVVRYQNQNYGTNLDRVAFDPNDRRWRYE